MAPGAAKRSPGRDRRASLEGSGRGGLERVDLALAAATAILALALYAATACRTIAGGDSAELAAAAALFGVPHPPGYPLWTLVTGALVHLAPLGEPAFRANLASGLYGAAAVAACFLLARRLRCGRVASACGALVLALGRTFWSQCTLTEVYTFDLACAFAAMHAVLSACASDSRRAWLTAGAVLGLWILHRTVNVVYLPAFLVLASSAGGLPSLFRHARHVLAGLALSALVILYLPIASRLDPAVDIGDPETLGRMRTVLSGAPYLRHLAEGSGARALTRLSRFAVSLPQDCGLGLLLAIVAAAVALRTPGSARRTVLALLLLVGTNLAFAARFDILDIEPYFLVSHAALALLAALGAELLLARTRAARVAVSVLLAVGIAALLGANLPANDRSGDRSAWRLGEDLLDSVAPDALLFVDGDTAIHATWYLQSVEGRAPGVVVLSLGHVTDWHMAQLAQRFPADPWPRYVPGRPRAVHARLVARALGVRRPVFLALSVDPQELLGPGPERVDAAPLVHGLALELVPRGGQVDGVARARASLELLERGVEGLGPIPEQVDMDTRSTLLQYALATVFTAELLAGTGEVELAERCAELVRRLDPDRQEAFVREDVRRGLGQEIPRLDLAARVSRAVEASRR